MLYGITYSVSALTNAEINDMVAAHNAVRQRVAQAESLRLGGRVSIPNLAWEPAIAAVAQEWADTLIKNNPPIIVHREDLQQRGLGENIYEGWATNVPIDQSAGKAMEFWASEEPWYNYTKNTCEAPPDRSCGHYTQVVWSSTRWLGCGRATRKIDNKEYVIWVCNYKPPGNISGQRPYSVRPEGVINGGQKQNLIPLFHLLLK
jgi:hypothetical protein